MKELMRNIALLLTLLVVVSVCGHLACGSSDKTAPVSEPTPTPTLTKSPTSSPIPSLTPSPSPIPVDLPTTRIEPDISDNVVITIGNLTDVTGVASNALNILTMALEDIAGLYNDHDLIPGVEFKVITYDTQYNPDLDTTGYEWLKERGADFIFTPVASAATTLKPRLENDQMVLFTVAPTEAALVPPGYVFCTGNASGRDVSYTTLEWMAAKDPDFPVGRPAKIGGAYWVESYAEEILKGAEEYAEVHPNKYEWVGSFLSEFTFSWEKEVEALKACDYVLPPAPVNQFAIEYRSAGNTAKFVGTDAHLVFLGMVDSADIWGKLDGMLFVKPGRWWNEDDDLIVLTKSLLFGNHPDEAEKIMRGGSGYLTVRPFHVMFSLIEDTVEAVGAENFISQAIYDSARSFSMTIDDLELYSFNETKRVSSNYLGVYELNAAEKDIFRIDPEWYPMVNSP